MRNFFNLVSFEYKKIFMRKSAIIALILVMATVAASLLMIFSGMSYVDGKPFETHYEAMVKDRAYAMALSGRAVDETLIAEAFDAYSKVPNVDRYTFTQEYQQYARPYSEIFRLMRGGYLLNMDKMRGLTDYDIQNYYQIRHDNVENSIRAGAISDAAKDTLVRLDSEIETPFIFAYIDGSENFMLRIYTIGVLCAFALAVCLAPVFSGEYSAGVDQLILSSKLGKSKVILAKLFASFSLTAVYFTLLLLIAAVMCMQVYGYDGASSPVQLIIPSLAYPLTIFECTVILAVCAFAGVLVNTALTLLLSSKFKSPFGVIIIISVLIFTPLMLNVPETFVRLYNLYSLLPTNMATLWEVFSHVPYDFFGLILPPYVFMPVFAVAAIAAMLPFAWQGFRNHQIG